MVRRIGQPQRGSKSSGGAHAVGEAAVAAETFGEAHEQVPSELRESADAVAEPESKTRHRRAQLELAATQQA